MMYVSKTMLTKRHLYAFGLCLAAPSQRDRKSGSKVRMTHRAAKDDLDRRDLVVSYRETVVEHNANTPVPKNQGRNGGSDSVGAEGTNSKANR